MFFNFLIRVECQPTDADHEGTSIEEDEVVLKKASKKDKKEVQKSSVSVRPRKRKITSQKDAISQLSTTFENLQKAQDKRIQTWLEADQRREEAFLTYQEKQAELNRQHDGDDGPSSAAYATIPNAWVMHEPAFPSAYSGTESQQPHYTNLDSYNQ